MVYLEYLRVRRVFIWFAAIVIVVCGFMIAGAIVGNGVNIDMSDAGPTGSHTVHVDGLASLKRIVVPVEALVGIAGFLALAFGTALAGSLNRDTQNAHFLFVRPVSRLRMAVLTIGVDVGAIVIAEVFGLVFAFATVAGMFRDHLMLQWNADALGIAALGLGASVMWYGMLQLLSSWTARRGGPFIGIGCGLFGFSIPMSHAAFLGPLQYVFKAILFVDPLAYFTSVSIGDAGDVSVGAQIFASLGSRTLAVWLIAAIALAVSTVAWRRVEV